jgi:hypothetical protein
VTEAEPFEVVSERSGCAFASVEALCDSFREHHLSGGTTWVSDGCAPVEQRSSRGAFAEVRTIAIRVGHDRVEDDVARVERALFAGTVREPAGLPATTQVLVIARIGHAWFPIVGFHPEMEGEIPGDRLAWELEETGATLSWTEERGATRRSEPSGYGETERTIAVVYEGVPKIAASATVERWRNDLDYACVRTCADAPGAPPRSECEARCRSSARRTRTWERSGNTVRIGATVVTREGPPIAGDDAPAQSAETKRLDTEDGWLGFCAFTPVVRAVAPAALPDDPESVAARARALEAIRRGRFRALRGASAAAEPGAPRATIEIFATGGGGCGGGGCSMQVDFRTIEGAMPTEGVGYFYPTRGGRVGCDPRALPEAGGMSQSTIVEVAPAMERADIGCGFSGFDGTTRRYWVIVRVLERGR